MDVQIPGCAAVPWRPGGKKTSMRRLPPLFNELETVSPAVARRLVDPLFDQTASLTIGACVFLFLGVLCHAGTGSRWYLAGAAASAFLGLWRLWEIRRHARDPAPPLLQARRFLLGAWITAAFWGAWSAAVLYEPSHAIVVMISGAVSGSVVGAVIRNSTVRAVAIGQIMLTFVPLAGFCLVSPVLWFNLLAGFIVLNIMGALSLSQVLHRQTLTLLLQDAEKTALLHRLESANQELEDTNQELEVVNRHLETLAATDALTGVANRRAFDLAAAREWRRSARDRAPLSLLLMDIDHFKAFNDFHGHPEGDACLRAVAGAIGSALSRPGDLLARYGGEEFVVILPATRLDGAIRIGEAILATLAARALPHEASAFGHVTLSIGAACLTGDATASVECLTARADAALYAAKRGGRNRLRAAPEEGAGVMADPMMADG